MRYLTKDWYIACQTAPMTPEVQKRLDDAVTLFVGISPRVTVKV